MPEIIFSQAYNRRDFSPSMPILDIGVSRPGASAPYAVLEAIIDTGADGTLFPRDILESAGALYVDRVALIGITGDRQLVDVFLVTLHLDKLRIRGVRAVALPAGEKAILGRDALNQLQLNLNGPATVTEVLS